MVKDMADRHKLHSLSRQFMGRAIDLQEKFDGGINSVQIGRAEGGPIPGYRNGGPTRFGIDEESVRMREFRNPPKHGISTHRVPPKLEVWDRTQD